MKRFRVVLEDGSERIVEAESAADAQAMAERSAEPVGEEGAPFRARLAVGAARTAEDQFRTVRKFFPDAEPTGDGNYIITDKYGRKQSFNPEGFDWGDIGDYGRQAAEFLGGTVGGIGGGLMGSAMGPAGTIGGAMAGAGAGGAAVGDMYTAGMALLGPTEDTRGLGERAYDTASSALWNAAGEGVGRGIGAGVSSLARRLIGGDASEAAARAQQLRDAGIPPESLPGEVSGQSWFQRGINTTANMPGGGRVLSERDRALEMMRSRAQGIASEAAGGAVPPAGTQGEVLRAGQERAAAAMNRAMSEAQDEMFARTKGLRVTDADLEGGRSLLREWKAEVAEAPNAAEHLAGPIRELEGYLNDAAEGGIPFRTLRERLTHIDQSLKSPQAGTGYIGKAGQARAEMARVLRDDTRNASFEYSPEARNAVQKHDSMVSAFLSEGPSGRSNSQMLGDMARRGTDQLPGYALSGSKTGGARLEQLRDLMAPEDWNAYRASVLNESGINPSTQQFSGPRFAGEMNRLAPGARSILAGEQSGQVDALRNVGDMMRGVEQRANTSSTFTNAAAMAPWAGALSSPVTAAAAGPAAGAMQLAGSVGIPALNAVFSKAITSPKFAQWLAGQLPENVYTEALKGAGGRMAAMPALPAGRQGGRQAEFAEPDDPIGQVPRQVALEAIGQAINMARKMGAHSLERDLMLARRRGTDAEIEMANRQIGQLIKRLGNAGDAAGVQQWSQIFFATKLRPLSGEPKTNEANSNATD